jgi:ammonia channel protein AmtB
MDPIDHGGSLAVNVATGAATLGVLLAGGAGEGRMRSAAVSRNTGVAGVMLVTLGWIVWLASVEFAVDDITIAITVNSIVGAVGGVVGWLVVQRIRHQRTTLDGVTAGLVSGLVSITAGAALFTPAFAGVAGILSGAAACAFTLNRVAATRRQQWFLVGSHLIAGATGLVILGLFATGIGFVFTGQLLCLTEQAASAILIAAYSAGVSFLLWSGLKRLVGRKNLARTETL